MLFESSSFKPRLCAIESRSERHKGVPDVGSRRKTYRRHPALLRGHYGEERIFEQARRWCDFGPRSRVAIAYSGFKAQLVIRLGN